jgi:hypothetical protein
MTFDTVKRLGKWTPIRDCPGRFVLRGVLPAFSVVDLLGDIAGVQQFQSPRATDTVWVVCLEGGGVISYRRLAGTWRHTLNTEEGFRRKLEQLEISLHEPHSQGIT